MNRRHRLTARFGGGLPTARVSVLLLAALLLLGIDHSPGIAKAFEVPESGSETQSVRSKFAGRYYRGDGLGLNLYLTLNMDGTFTCVWRGCLGEYGTCAGTWKGNGREVKLHTIKKDGMFKDRPPGNLKVGRDGKKIILIPAEEKDLFSKLGPSRVSCYYRVDQVPRR